MSAYLAERLASAEMRARSLREQADAADAEVTALRQQVANNDNARRASELAEENIERLAVTGDDGTVRGYVDVIQSPWSVTGVGSRRRLVGVGRDGKLLVVYELRDTTRIRGNRRLARIHGDPPPAHVDLAIARRFA